MDRGMEENKIENKNTECIKETKTYKKAENNPRPPMGLQQWRRLGFI